MLKASHLQSIFTRCVITDSHMDPGSYVRQDVYQLLAGDYGSACVDNVRRRLGRCVS
jgi:hypothetical protein